MVKKIILSGIIIFGLALNTGWSQTGSIQEHRIEETLRRKTTAIRCKAAKEYGRQLTETVLLGTAASLFRNQELIWDGNNMKVTNLEAANSVIKPEFRTGWKL